MKLIEFEGDLSDFDKQWVDLLSECAFDFIPVRASTQWLNVNMVVKIDYENKLKNRDFWYTTICLN